MERRFDAVVPPPTVRPAQLPARGKSRISEPGDASEREAAVLARQVTGSEPASRGARPADAGARATRARYDFSGVRVHADERAGATARDALHASAFTVGSHIVFAPGTYAPDTADGPGCSRMSWHTLSSRAKHQASNPSRSSATRQTPEPHRTRWTREPQMTSSDSCNWPA